MEPIHYYIVWVTFPEVYFVGESAEKTEYLGASCFVQLMTCNIFFWKIFHVWNFYCSRNYIN